MIKKEYKTKRTLTYFKANNSCISKNLNINPSIWKGWIHQLLL